MHFTSLWMHAVDNEQERAEFSSSSESARRTSVIPRGIIISFFDSDVKKEITTRRKNHVN
jgi:hypothetical protein